LMCEIPAFLLLAGPSPHRDLKEVEMRIVQSDKAPPALLLWLALDPKTSGKVLVKLFGRSNPLLRRIILSNPNCPAEIHAKIMVDWWD